MACVILKSCGGTGESHFLGPVTVLVRRRVIYKVFNGLSYGQLSFQQL